MANKKSGINRKGLEVVLPSDIQEAILENEGSVTVDGELINATLYAFDYLVNDLPYKERLILLGKNYGTNKKGIKVVYTAFTTEGKQMLFNELKARNAEGIVFKDLRAMYTPGRPASGGTQLKFKFYDSATCIVGSINQTKRSISLLMIDDEGNEVNVGNATIYPNFAIPNPGDFVEIKYLYAYEGGSLYQPVYLGSRTDVDRTDCVLRKLKYKAVQKV